MVKIIKYYKKMNIEKNGIEIIKIEQKIKKIISDDIKKNISKKLNLHINSNFYKISNKINKIDDKTFNELFGNVAKRYLSYNATKKINLFINTFKLNRNFKKVFLHQMSPSDLKANPKLNKHHYCVYYRVVRKQKKDTLFVHRDSDFWKLHKKNKNLAPIIPYHHNRRIKVWIPIFGCNKQNSLKLFNFSHLHKIKSKYKIVKGLRKPLIEKTYIKKNIKNVIMPFKNFKSDSVIFDDKCVHFAPVNFTSPLRISCELTAMISQ